MTRDSLEAAIHRALTGGVRRQAQEIGTKLRSEDGNARAVEALLDMLILSRRRTTNKTAASN
jgi:ribosomal 50S subunit-associated protein YjgA (DUF615 family)